MTKHYVNVELQADGRVFIGPYSFTENGPLIGDGLPTVVGSIDDPALGQVAVDALFRSNARVLPERDLYNDPPDREFLAWLGLADYAEYVRGVRMVQLLSIFDDKISSVKLTPTKNGGARSGFTPLIEERVDVPCETPAQLGDAIREAMKLATV